MTATALDSRAIGHANRILSFIAEHEGRWTYSHRRLSELVGIPVKTVKRGLQDLERCGRVIQVGNVIEVINDRLLRDGQVPYLVANEEDAVVYDFTIAPDLRAVTLEVYSSLVSQIATHREQIAALQGQIGRERCLT